MKIAERRRAVLRDVADYIARVRPGLARYAAVLHYEKKADESAVALGLHDEIDGLTTKLLLASLPDGCVVYQDDEVGIVGLERDGITLELPNETPDEVVDALFSIASEIDERPLRLTVAELATRAAAAVGEVECGA